MDVVPLLPSLYFLRFPVGHVYLWCDAGGLTLIDSGVVGSAPLIAGAIRELGHHRSDVRRLVLTHFHADHVGSAAEIAGWGEVEVCAHHAEAPVIRGETEGPAPVLADWERLLLDHMSGLIPPTPPTPVRVDIELRDGDVLDFGGGATAVAAPGHTPGSLTVYLPGPRVLFTGDTMARRPNGRTILGVFNADPALAAESFTRLAQLDTEVVCFGHGEPLTQDATAQLRGAAAKLATQAGG
jgi:glyoxylase-like metal-dependent hydrolase (beta-lactamase superfamily II)